MTSVAGDASIDRSQPKHAVGKYAQTMRYAS